MIDLSNHDPTHIPKIYHKADSAELPVKKNYVDDLMVREKVGTRSTSRILLQY